MSILQPDNAFDVVKDFLVSSEKSLRVPMMPLNFYIEAFKRLGYIHYDQETTGWESDFVIEAETEDGNPISLRGTLMYGNFTLSIPDTDDRHFRPIYRYNT